MIAWNGLNRGSDYMETMDERIGKSQNQICELRRRL